MFYSGIFATVLCGLLVVSGTGLSFSALVFLFILLFTVAFNVAGGMTRTSGTYIFFFTLLAVVLGLMVKILLWESAEVTLHSPVTTMATYVGGMLAMMAAAYLSRRFARKEGFLQDICSVEDMGRAAVGCVIGGLFLPIVVTFMPESGSTLFKPIISAATQLNHFPDMAVILGVTYEIKASRGKRSLNVSTWLAFAYFFYFGVFMGFSKQALFTPIVCWLISCAALRFRFSLFQVGALGLLLVFSNYYLVPYCQYGRGVDKAGKSEAQRVASSFQMMTHLDDVRTKYRESMDPNLGVDDQHRFFLEDEGLFERLEMFGIDDALVTLTDDKGAFGMGPYLFYISSIVPRVIWKDKPQIGMGNVFAHELGFNEEDTTTGISFSPVAEAYHEAKWFGVLVVIPIALTLLFTIMDSLCGDLRKSPWGLLVLAMYAHIAPEGGIQGIFYVMTYGTLIVLVVAYFSAYVMPLLSSLVMPPKRNLVPIGTARAGRGPAFANGEPVPVKR